MAYHASRLLQLALFGLLLSRAAADASCADSACDANTPCPVHTYACCNNVCVLPNGTRNEGDACSDPCNGCSPGLCCQAGICSRDCYQTKSQTGCTCITDADCTGDYLFLSCIDNKCKRKVGHMDRCESTNDCEDSWLTCGTVASTGERRCIVGNINSPYRENFTCPVEAQWHICDPMNNTTWLFCDYEGSSQHCVPSKQVGDRCRVSDTAFEYPCRSPWLTCAMSHCTPFFSVPLGGRCDGPSQCQIPLVCNHTFFNYNTPSSNSAGYCTIPFDDQNSCSDDTRCRWPLQKCGCKDADTACLAVDVDIGAQAKWSALESCGQSHGCYPPMYSAYGWITWRDKNSCIHQFCQSELLDFYCSYSCKTGTVFPGLKCDGPSPSYTTPNCCGGDQQCYSAFYDTIKQQKQFCTWQHETDFTYPVPPITAPVDDSTPSDIPNVPIISPITTPISEPRAEVKTDNSDYTYIVTTVAVALGLAIGATIFGLFYWRKKSQYERINWHNSNSVNMQQIGISVGQ